MLLCWSLYDPTLILRRLPGTMELGQQPEPRSHTLRVRANRAFKDHPHQTSLPTEGRAGPREGQELPQGHSAGWLQNPGLLRHPCPKSKVSSIQRTFIQSILRSRHCGLKEEHWTESQAPALSHCVAWASHCPSLGLSLTTCQG